MNCPWSLRVQLTTIVTVVSFLLATMAPVTASARAAVPAKPDQPVSKTESVSSFVQGSNANGTFYGVLTITHFDVVGGLLTASGNFAGLATPNGSTTSADASQAFRFVPVTVDPSCSILNLTLGPLNLNILGLVVMLNQVHLTITAISGAGNLLGNLLCAVANLLNPGSLTSSTLSTLLTDLSNLLNQILTAIAAL